MPALSDRRNIVVIADEAHRSQYDLIDGLARHMRDTLPFATFIGFTGTPIEKADANTRAVFGDYISVYDIQRAVADKATVPIYYEPYYAALNAAVPKLDEEFEESPRRADAQGEAQDQVGGAGNAGDPSASPSWRLSPTSSGWEAMDGKAMVVCMSRRICVGCMTPSSACVRTGPAPKR